MSLRSNYHATKTLFCGLAVSSSITALEFPRVHAWFVRSAEALTTHPFSHLRYLMCGSDEEAMISLIPHLDALEILDLTTWGHPSQLLLHIARLTNLQELIIRLVCLPGHDGAVFIAEQMLEIGRRCNKLIRLHLEDPVNDDDPVAHSDIDDEQMDQLLSTMPQLQHLCLKFGTGELTVDVWTVIGRRCRDLRSVSIAGQSPLAMALSEVEEECLFPRLQILEVDYIENLYYYALRDHSPPPAGFIKIIHQHAPRLKALSCPYIQSYPHQCTEIWPGQCPIVSSVRLVDRNANLNTFLPQADLEHSVYANVVI